MFYVLDEHNNKVEAFDKQGVLAVLEQAIESGSLEGITSDSAFITKLKCCVGTGTHHIAFVPQATYNELQANGQLLNDAYYFITDDTTTEDINDQLEALTEAVNNLTTTVTNLDDKTILTNNSTITKKGVYVVKALGFQFILMIDSLTLNAFSSHEYYDAGGGSIVNYQAKFNSATKKIRLYNNTLDSETDASINIVLLKEL